jgi:hypothetical protein
LPKKFTLNRKRKSRLCRKKFLDYKSLLIFFFFRHRFYSRHKKREKSCLDYTTIATVETARQHNTYRTLSTRGSTYIFLDFIVSLETKNRHKLISLHCLKGGKAERSRKGREKTHSGVYRVYTQPTLPEKQEMSFDIIFIPFNMFYGNHLCLNFFGFLSQHEHKQTEEKVR